MDRPADQQTLVDHLKSMSRPWHQVNSLLKQRFTEIADREGVGIPEDALFIDFPAPEDTNHPLNSSFETLPSSSGRASTAISLCQSLFIKNVLLNVGDEHAKDKCLELRNLWLMRLDLASHSRIRALLQTIIDQQSYNKELMQVLVALSNEAIEVKKRFELFNTIHDPQNRRPEWMIGRLVEFIQRFESEEEDEERHVLIFNEIQQFARENLDRMRPADPRIISLEFFSMREIQVDGNRAIELVLITKSNGQDLMRFLSNLDTPRGGAYSVGEELPIKQREMIELMIQMTECLHWMHTNHFLHGDLKLDNFLITPGPDPTKPLEGAQICLIDLGQSRKSDATRAAFGFSPFMAPEFGEGRTKKTDIFAFGMTLMQLLLPVAMEKWTKSFSKDSVLPDVPDFDPDLHRLITSCLSKESGGRPTTGEILLQLNQIRDKPESENDVPREIAAPICASLSYSFSSSSSSSSASSPFSSSSFSSSSSSSPSSSLNKAMGSLSLNADQ